jgi:hypothetical protein
MSDASDKGMDEEIQQLKQRAANYWPNMRMWCGLQTVRGEGIDYADKQHD